MSECNVKQAWDTNLRFADTRSRLMISNPCLSVVCYFAMNHQSIILTLALVAGGLEHVDQEEKKYVSSSFNDLVQLARQEITLITHLKDYRENIVHQIRTMRKNCEDKSPDISDIAHINRSFPTVDDIIGGAIGLVYIQIYYGLKMEDIIQGNISASLYSDKWTESQWSYQSPHTLAADDAKYIARAAQVLGR